MLTTSQRGYGWAHQQLRARLLHQLARNPGQPCPQDFPDGTICGRPMYPYHLLHLGHTHGQAAYLGLVHAACNVRAAQLWAQAAHAQRPAASRQW